VKTIDAGTLAEENVFVSFLLISLSTASVLDFAPCFFTFVVDCDLLTAASLPAAALSSDLVKLGFALSALSDLTRVLDSLLTVSVVDSARLESLGEDAAAAAAAGLTVSLSADDGLLAVTARLLLVTPSECTGTLATVVDVNEDRLRPVVV